MLKMLNHPMTSAVSLSEVRRQFGLTARAIRHYEDIGLISAERDRHNCRRFDARATSRLRIIVEFRRAGLSLGDIREILDVQDDAQRDIASEDLAIVKLSERLGVLEAERQAVLQAMSALAPSR